jgi:tetratricopeptide (TPR) repeat protein
MKSYQIRFDRKEVAVCVFLFLAIAIVFGQTVRHEFINLDDNKYVYANPHVSHGVTPSGIAWAFSDGSHAVWIPLTWLSLMIDWNLYDVHAGGYHLSNVLLHSATAMLLFLVLQRMTNRFLPSAFVAAIFAIHPLRVESVTWITERKDVLSGLFFMATLWAYWAYTRHRFSLARYLLVIVLFALGLMAKAMLVTLPCVLLLLDYWPLGRLTSQGCLDVSGEPSDLAAQRIEKWRAGFATPVRRIIEKIPLFLVAGGDCFITYWVQNASLGPNDRLSLSWRIGNALITYVTYLEKFFYPAGLAIVYPRLPLDLPHGKIIVSVLILVSITIAVFIGRRRCPYLLVGWLWYLGMVTPVIGILQVGLTSVADRFTYLPQIGLAIALTWGAADLCKSWPYRRWICGVASTAILAVLMGCAYRQASFWCDSETLWNHTLECTTQNFTAHNNLGTVLATEGRFDDAITHFKKAMTIAPDAPMTYSNMGSILLAAGHPKAAMDCFKKAIALDPDYTDAHDRLGMLLANSGHSEEAIPHFESSLRINPNNAETHYDLGKALMAIGRQDEAKRHFQKGAEIDPDYAVSHHQLGVITAHRGLFMEAAEHFQRALDANPDFLEARNDLAKLLADHGRIKEAIAQYQIVLKKDPRNAEALDAMTQLRAK